MTDSPANLTPSQRKKRNDDLRQKSEARLKARGAPFFGVTESEILDIKMQIPQLIETNNRAVKEIKDTQEQIKKLQQDSYEHKLIIDSMKDLLESAGLLTKSAVAEVVEKKQLEKMGLVPKGEGSIVERGDHLLIKFKILHDGKVVDDQTAGLMAYEVGSGALPCEGEMLSMKELETKTASMICNLKSPQLKPYFGEIVEMEIHVAKIMRKVA